MKEENGSKKLVLKFPDGLGTCIGEAHWKEGHALRKAGDRARHRPHGLDLRRTHRNEKEHHHPGHQESNQQRRAR